MLFYSYSGVLGNYRNSSTAVEGKLGTESRFPAPIRPLYPVQHNRGIDTMIPEWSPNGDLPPGVHVATWEEIEERLAFNIRRRRLLAGFREACGLLRRAGCKLVYLDSSFVSTKEHPGDFDACWGIQNVDDDVLDPVSWYFS